MWARFGVDFGSILGPQTEKNRFLEGLGEPQGAQEAPKRAQEAPKSLQRGAQEAPKTLQEASWAPRWRPFSLKNWITNHVFRLVLFWKVCLKRLERFFDIF